MNMKRSRISKRVSWAPGLNLCQPPLSQGGSEFKAVSTDKFLRIKGHDGDFPGIPEMKSIINYIRGFLYMNCFMVKLFSSEDFPAKVGLKSEDHHQAKLSKILLHSNTKESGDLPPGFEHGFVARQSQHPRIPQIQWTCPSKIVLSNNCHVASGEESEEVNVQNSRESRVLEAVYPRISSIPPNPAVSLEVQNEHYDDSSTPIVPIIPIEEESIHTPYIPEPVNSTIRSQPLKLSGDSLRSEVLNTSKCDSPAPSSALSSLGKLPNLSADVIAAASTALSVMDTVSQNGNMIDTDLLIKILGDPIMIQKLINDGPVANAGSAATDTVRPPITANSQSAPMSLPRPEMQRSANGNLHRIPDIILESGFSRATPSVPTSTPESNRTNGNLYTTQGQVRPQAYAVNVQPKPAPLPSSLPMNEARHTKDVNYYKNLIRKHGGEKQETGRDPILARKRNYNDLQDLKPEQNNKYGEFKLKNSKPCKYFKSTRGCRNGVNCPYQHDAAIQWRAGSLFEAHISKRTRLGGEITGSS
ncbi:hypothetical protein FNV43_RR18562 [Rhamnella rubrinervis]|uniref:C3H1-type domain-containing protein n=1 Tax=Rhamnella rubrinervis TaxID=2594499 RepID=A0A8K0GWI9_9ROSA|nr:hypothetical protein FNV43_RR18562 [Rhamnella rubrinervis]